jgi:cytosine/adenosine deaminase-related metal-dependent hydrolase
MIIAADWIFPVTFPPLRHHAIVFENGRIREIRPAVPSDPYVDGACILPGLINTHTHLAYTTLRNLFDDQPFFLWIRKLTTWKYQSMTDADFAAATQEGIAENLQAGITTIADLSDSESSLQVLSRGPLRGIFYWEIFGVEKEQAEKTWENLPGTYAKLQQYRTDRLRIGVSPHSCYTVRPELYANVAAWTLAEKIPVSFHVAESKLEEEFISSRKGPIAEFLKDRAADWKISESSSIRHLAKTGIFRTKPLVAHAVQASLSDLKILADAGVAISHCPKSNAKFGHGIAPLSQMLDYGIRVGLGTDSAASNNRFDLFEEARFGLLLQRVTQNFTLSEQKMLELMTIDGARALEMQDSIGSLEPGKFADFVIVSMPSAYKEAQHVLHHLIHNSTPSDVLKTVIGGNIVYQRPPI